MAAARSDPPAARHISLVFGPHSCAGCAARRRSRREDPLRLRAARGHGVGGGRPNVRATSQGRGGRSLGRVEQGAGPERGAFVRACPLRGVDLPADAIGCPVPLGPALGAAVLSSRTPPSAWKRFPWSPDRLSRAQPSPGPCCGAERWSGAGRLRPSKRESAPKRLAGCRRGWSTAKRGFRQAAIARSRQRQGQPRCPAPCWPASRRQWGRVSASAPHHRPAPHRIVHDRMLDPVTGRWDRATAALLRLIGQVDLGFSRVASLSPRDDRRTKANGPPSFVLQRRFHEFWSFGSAGLIVPGSPVLRVGAAAPPPRANAGMRRRGYSRTGGPALSRPCGSRPGLLYGAIGCQASRMVISPPDPCFCP